jgi:hypothetical protein
MAMTAFEGILIVLLSLFGVGVAVIVVTLYRILEGIDHLLFICHEEVTEDVPSSLPSPLTTPSEMPHQRNLMDIIRQPPSDLTNGSFEGHQPWEPPPEPKV